MTDNSGDLDPSRFSIRCVECGWTEKEGTYAIRCGECGGLLDAEFSRIKDPLPGRAERKRMIDYIPWLPVTDRELVEPLDYEITPIIEATVTAREFGFERLALKNELASPTGSFKDREAFICLYRLAKMGVERAAFFSSGNTGTSLARAASLLKRTRLNIFTPIANEERFRENAGLFDPEFVKIEGVPGGNDEAHAYSVEFARKHGLVLEGGFENWARREGVKTFGLEAIDQGTMSADIYLQAVTSGIGVYSIWKACKEWRVKLPAVWGVQHEFCAPMERAFREDSETLEDRHIPRFSEDDPDFPKTIRVLRTRRPESSYSYCYKVIKESGGNIIAVNDEEVMEVFSILSKEEELVESLRSLKRRLGLEPATAMAGLFKARRLGLIPEGLKVLVNLSGSAKKGDLKHIPKTPLSE